MTTTTNNTIKTEVLALPCLPKTAEQILDEMKGEIKYDDKSKILNYKTRNKDVYETTFNWSRLIKLLNIHKEIRKDINFIFDYRKNKENEIKWVNVINIRWSEMEWIYFWKQSLPRTLENKYNILKKELEKYNTIMRSEIYWKYETWEYTWEQVEEEIKKNYY